MAERSGFFDFQKQVQATRNASRTETATEAMSVTQVTKLIESAIRSKVPGQLHVRGELSNVTLARSGHFYFTLKDADSCLDAVMFQREFAGIRFKPENGLEVIADGGIRVYAKRGIYQLYCTRLEPVGTGALELAFRQMQAKLQAEGLFDPDRKRPLPVYPRRIAMVTSTATAALQDMLKVFAAYPFLKLTVFNVPVQGDGAADKIAGAIRHLSTAVSKTLAYDAIIVARGGGSLEDLWAFNEEAVARAIAVSKVPVITGIGHETDVSIADLVGDYHAHTPTEAAQVAVRAWKAAPAAIGGNADRLVRVMRNMVQLARQRLTGLGRHELFRRPMDLVDVPRMRLDDLHKQLVSTLGQRIDRLRRRHERLVSRLAGHHPKHRVKLHRERLEATAREFRREAKLDLRQRRERLESNGRRLVSISPEAVLKRGYAIVVRKHDGVTVRRVGEVAAGDVLVMRLIDGKIESVARDPKQLPLFEGR